jgi:hypothetical protein
MTAGAMHRRTLNLAASACMVLCVAACVMWVRSVFRFENVGIRGAPQGIIELRSGHGAVGFAVDPRLTRPLSAYWVTRPTSGRRMPLGSFHFSSGYWGIIFLVPYWVVVPACLISPALWVARRRRDRREGTVPCPSCGYDLRATPKRCPECGKLAEPAAV